MSTATQYFCTKEGRRDAVRSAIDDQGQPLLNGIDYLEIDVTEEGLFDQNTLNVFCIHPLPPTFPTEVAVVIDGGVRIVNISAHPVSVENNKLVVKVDSPGDFSSYTLRLLDPASLTDQVSSIKPPVGFDPQLAQVEFSFKVGCPSEFDCQVESACPTESFVNPDLHYLAKDYGTFRQLMLDRLSAIMPDWKERSPADLQMALVEVLAFVGDYLSYYQDAVATEAYLGTARKRISVRRHARLLDYFMHDGCNARAWVTLEVKPGSGADGVTLPPKTSLLTKGMTAHTIISHENFLREASSNTVEIFEIMEEVGREPVTLHASHNRIQFYTWSDLNCCLPTGATRATFQDRIENNQRQLQLKQDDFLLFEEVVNPQTGSEADADPTHRQVIRITKVSEDRIDPLNDTPVVEIEWNAEDALTFPLCLSSPSSASPCSIARGNVLLADHGQTWPQQNVSPETVPDTESYRPILEQGPLTFQGIPVDSAQSAQAAMIWNVHQATPAIHLTSSDSVEDWVPRKDLLASDEFSHDFVVEMERDGTPHLRFGDGILGKRPVPNDEFTATYRIGNGTAGNIGSGAITRIVWDGDGITNVWNPLPASGGIDPEGIEQVRQYAPQAFRRQERAVTESDYGVMATRHPEVQKATARFRWTGSWYTAFVTVDRTRGRAVDRTLSEDMTIHLEPFRMAGQDVEIREPIFVPLDIVMQVCVRPGYFRNRVQRFLLDVFSSYSSGTGQMGFFHPDKITFGQPVYLSQLYEIAMRVDGIASVEVTKFQRWGQLTRREIAQGILRVDDLEIVQLANDPNFPENGKIDFVMMGGL